MGSGSERPELIWAEGRRCFPVVITDQINVLPSEWRQMGQITGCRMLPVIAQVIDGEVTVPVLIDIAMRSSSNQ